MNRLRVLYLDVPFEKESGGDKNRSRFLWAALQDEFDPRWVQLGSSPHPAAAGIQPVLQLPTRPGRGFQSQSVLHFDPAGRAAFRRLLDEQPCDAVVCRFHAPWELAGLAHDHPSRPAVLVDLDMVSSRLVGLTWSQSPSFRNRWFLFERWKLARLERRLLARPFLIWFSNPVELQEARAAAGPTPARFAELPNVMPGVSPRPPSGPRTDVLFFGSLNSAANTDGFRFLVDEVLPRIQGDLRAHGARLRVAGKNPPAWFAERLRQAGTDRVELVGGVPSMEQAIADSRFVLLPLRVASGTRTRILEAAAQERAVVTTPIGAEGIDVGGEALVRDDPDGLAAAVRQLLADPAGADALGTRLRARCRERYSSERVAARLQEDLRSFVASRRHLPA